MNGYSEKDQTHVIVAYDDYKKERRNMLVLKHDVDKTIEALKGQGCPCGCWDLFYWNRVKKGVMSGKIKLF